MVRCLHLPCKIAEFEDRSLDPLALGRRRCWSGLAVGRRRAGVWLPPVLFEDHRDGGRPIRGNSGRGAGVNHFYVSSFENPWLDRVWGNSDAGFVAGFRSSLCGIARRHYGLGLDSWGRYSTRCGAIGGSPAGWRRAGGAGRD